jgi:outer membrane protein assembly factor BamB
MTRSPLARFCVLAVLSVVASCFSAALVSAENWPCWRGPRGDGSSEERGVPTRWDGAKGDNVAWKVEISGTGHASPIVWQDRIFLVSCLEQEQDRVLICLDRETGKTLWQRSVLKSPLEKKHALNSYASSTPATDGELVYVLQRARLLQLPGAV